MKPFTALKYFFENKKRGLICFIVLIFTVCAVALITGLVNSIPESAIDSNAKPLLNYSAIYSTLDEPLEASIVKGIEEQEATDKMVAANYSQTSMKLAIGGNTSVPVIWVDASNFSYSIEKTKAKLKEGRFPEEGKHEMVVHWRIMKNKGWKVGDFVGKEVDTNEWFPGKHEIVGVLDGPTIMALSIKEVKKEDQEVEPGFYLIFFKEGHRKELNNYLATINPKDIGSFYYEETKLSIDENLKSLSSTLLVIIIVVVLILSISVSALMYIIYLQRLDEFGILYALGYKRRFIKNMIIKEILALNILGWIFGLIFSLFAVYILNTLIYFPKGNLISVYSIKVLVYTGIIPLVVAFASILPVTKKLKKCDPIAIIERRD